MTEEVKTVDMALSPELDKEINTFLTTHSLPNEADISDYTKYLTMKYGGNTRALKKDIVEKVKQHVRDGIMKNILYGEISKFLERYPQPEKSDVDDFIKYMGLLKLNLDENNSIEMLKQLSKKKVLLALNDSIIRDDVGRFLDRYRSYTQEDIEKFINYLRSKKLEVDSDTILDILEKERLCLKFEDTTREETWQEKISREYISLFNSPESVDYKYLMLDEELTCQLLKKISKQE
jgi:hypothetical protein